MCGSTILTRRSVTEGRHHQSSPSSSVQLTDSEARSVRGVGWLGRAEFGSSSLFQRIMEFRAEDALVCPHAFIFMCVCVCVCVCVRLSVCVCVWVCQVRVPNMYFNRRKEEVSGKTAVGTVLQNNNGMAAPHAAPQPT